MRARFRSSLTASDDVLLHRFDYTLWGAGRAVNDALGPHITSGDHLEKFDLFTRNPYTESPLLVDGEFLNPYGVINGVGLGLDVGATYRLAPDWYAHKTTDQARFLLDYRLHSPHPTASNRSRRRKTTTTPRIMPTGPPGIHV